MHVSPSRSTTPSEKSIAKRLGEIYAEAVMVPESKGEG